jgi:hypothetical protein
MIRLTIFEEDQVQAIHEATLRVLSETGVILSHPESRALLLEAGATIDGERILLPAELVERVVAQAPRTVTLRGRDGASRTIGDGGLYWHNLGGADIYAQTGQSACGVVRRATAPRWTPCRASTVRLLPRWMPGADVAGDVPPAAIHQSHCTGRACRTRPACALRMHGG